MTDKEYTLVNLLLNATGLNPEAYEKPKANKCVVYKRISTTPIAVTHDKQSTEKVRFQIDCYGTSHSDSRNLAMQIKNALDLNTTDFNISWLINDFTVKEIDLGIFRTVLEFFVF